MKLRQDVRPDALELRGKKEGTEAPCAVKKMLEKNGRTRENAT